MHPLFLVLLLLVGAAGCRQQPSGGDAAPKPGAQIKLGYVLHGLNDFTRIIEQGARDAARDENVAIDVVGPAGFSATSDAIAMFEGLVQKRVDGLVVVPMPGEVWITPIRQAAQAGVPVLTANVMSSGSAAQAWFGEDEYASGILLASELKKLLAAQNKNEGLIVVGICAPGLGVLVDRYEGLKKGLEGTRFQVSQPFDVNTENTANYGAWENLAGANPRAVAMVGLCSMDLPNLARLKQRTKAQWVLVGYDLGRETLDAIKAGVIQCALGQHPYLQGYLPVRALARHLRDRQPLPQGWIDVGAELVTPENAGAIYEREAGEAKQSEWYRAHIATHFDDVASLAKPWPSRPK